MKFFKNPIIIFLLFILIISIGVLGYFSVSTPNLYQEVENTSYKSVLDSDTPTVYYYYQTTCHYCESIKNEMTKFNNAVSENNAIDFKLVDMKDANNQDAWYDWDTHNKKFGQNTPPTANPNYISDPNKMKKIDDIKITGTPTMIYVKNHQVVDYQVGKDVFKLLNQVISEYKLNITLDDSTYGK